MNSSGSLPSIHDLDSEGEKDGSDENIEEVFSNSSKTTGKSKDLDLGRSIFWKTDFILIPSSQTKDGVRHAKCRHCGEDWASPGKDGTSNLKRHLPKCAALQNHDIRQTVMDVAGKIVSRKIDKEYFRELLALCVIHHGYALSFVEHEHFRNLIRYLNPNAAPIARNTLKATMLTIYNREKLIVKNTLLSIPGRISLTSDMWTSPTTRGYLTLTAHFIDSDWKLQSLVLNFLHMPPPHNSRTVHKVLFDLVKQWGIEKKVFSITLDNASYNDSMQVLLCQSLNAEQRLPCNGKFFHIRCCAHVLNLIVQDGYKFIDESAIKLRDGIKHVDASEGRKLGFVEVAKRAGCSTSKGLWLDCVTRWNSTHEMFERALVYREAFTALASEDKNFVWNLENEDWMKVNKICALMKPFSEITTLFSGTKYPTANLFLPNVIAIEMTLIKEMKSTDSYISAMAMAMKEKFNKYWGNSYNKVLAFAVILDPERKVDYLLYAYEKLDPVTFLEKSNEVVESLKELFEEYKVHPSSIVQPANTQCVTLDSEFDSYAPNPLATGRSSIDVYLKEERLPRDPAFNIMGWWKDNEPRFPDLAILARDILAIPITSVASESAFSLGGRVLTKYRHKLLPENAEALITTKSWLSREKNLNVVKEKAMGEEIVLPSTEDVTASKRIRV